MRRINAQAFATSPTPTPIHVAAVDNPGVGDPNLRYEFAGFNTVYNGGASGHNGFPAQFTALQLFFHDDYSNGPQPSGVTETAVLAAVMDHVQGKQNGPRACQENAQALSYIAAAMQLLGQRDARTPMGLPFMQGLALAS